MTAAYVHIADGHQLFVRDWGSGPAMLFLAGWAMDSRLWGETMVALNAQGIRTIAYDRRGHGRSSDPGVADYDLLADDLAAVIDALDLDDLVIVAHSGASGEAIRYISRYGASRIARLVLVGATGPCMLARADNPYGFPAEAADPVLAELVSDLAGWIDRNAEPFAPGASPRVIDWLGAMILDCSRRLVVDFQRAIVHADLRDEAAALRLPVTILHGDRDVSAPVDLTARRYAALIPHARVIIYEGAPHGLMITDRERLCADLAASVGLGGARKPMALETV
jgi:non-heme chloroperoxidase